jgi:hypothetical protein
MRSWWTTPRRSRRYRERTLLAVMKDFSVDTRFAESE